jgi:hypothetical protein
MGAGKMVYNFKWQTFTVYSAKTHQSVWLAFVSHNRFSDSSAHDPKHKSHFTGDPNNRRQLMA